MEGRNAVRHSGRGGQMGNSPLEKSARDARSTQPRPGRLDNRNGERSSRVHPDVIQELEKKTKDLITELEHVKRSLDPLALDFINILLQQVRTYRKFLSKPWESEQVRKQSHQREESFPEAEAVPKEGDGHKGKYQIPLDTSVSCGKGSGSQGQVIQPCLQSTVCNVQVLVTGKTFGSDQQFLNRVELRLRSSGTQFWKEDYTTTSDKLLLIFCPISTWLDRDLNHILENIPSHRKAILIVMHFTPNQRLSLYMNGSWIRHGSLLSAVDCRFSEDSGLYDCEMNTEAIISVASKLQQQGRQSREYMLLQHRDLEGRSQKQTDTVQEIGNKTKELMSEIERLKRFVDPLAPDLIDVLVQQVRFYMKLLSKTNQQPPESEQVRKQSDQREESFLEAKAIPEERDEHKGKCQIYQDASRSHEKGCKLQGQGMPSLQSRVFNVQVSITGQTFGSVQQFLNQVELCLHSSGMQLQKENFTPASDKLLLLFCGATSEPGSYIKALDKISNQRKVILVMMHCTPNQSLPSCLNSIQHNSHVEMVDCRISRSSGLFSCELNTEAISSVASKIKQQAEQSKNNIHRDVEEKNLERCSQKQTDIVQEIGSKTEELISEIEHLKQSVDPLVLDLINILVHQVSFYMKLLSKTDQQPLESELVRKQNHQKEESFPEAEAVPKEEDGHKGKCQIPLDASVSCGKGSSSQGQGIQPCLQSTVCSVQILVTGQTFGSEQQFLNQIEQHLRISKAQLQKEDYTLTSDKLLLLFCPVTSRYGTDISNALENIPDQREVILVVMHYSPNKNLPLYPNSSQVQHGSLINSVDCRFSDKSGLYSCRMNTEAITSVASNILQWQSSLKETIR
uniref:Uncharacterized protein LOC117356997 isoform X1 n=1 Tax=Geotrypetes seraphini TaxID=260995 RepID=A0A6P8QB44_GEOSA|nr:uncharacterized protein LOC117356997 isoform X1 [Geotrypetes seraphini]